MEFAPSHYRRIIDRALVGKLIETGFREVILNNCISYEGLFQRGDLWFGTSWDYRDQYLDLDFGHLYWIKDVMPRVIIAGRYESFYAPIKRLDSARQDYLEQVATMVADSIQAALVQYAENPSLADSKVSALEPFLLGIATEKQLAAYEA